VIIQKTKLLIWLNIYPKDASFCFQSLSMENKKIFKSLRSLRLCGEHQFLEKTELLLKFFIA